MHLLQGHEKVAATFARISGYVEQTDIHSPQVLLGVSILLKLPPLRLPYRGICWTRIPISPLSPANLVKYQVRRMPRGRDYGGCLRGLERGGG